MEKRGAPIGDLFDDLADEYLELREDVGWDPWPHVKAWLAESDLSGWRILDVGCGTGEVSRALAARGAHVVGVDASERMCELAAEQVAGVSFIQVDLGEGLPFGDGVFDAVLALGCVEYVPDIEGACAELVRVVRPGGAVLYVVELREEGLCGGEAVAFELYEAWWRYRRTYEEVSETAQGLLDEVQLARVAGYVFDDTGEWVGYARVMGKARGRQEGS